MSVNVPTGQGKQGVQGCTLQARWVASRPFTCLRTDVHGSGWEYVKRNGFEIACANFSLADFFLLRVGGCPRVSFFQRVWWGNGGWQAGSGP